MIARSGMPVGRQVLDDASGVVDDTMKAMPKLAPARLYHLITVLGILENVAQLDINA